MSITLKVEFDGLTSLVPKKAVNDPYSEAKQWLAVLPDLRRTFSAPARLPRPIAPHVACVVVPAEAVLETDSPKLPSMVFRTRRGRWSDQSYHLYEFNLEKLSFDLGISPGNRVLEAKPTDFGQQEEPTNAGEEKDLGWVAPMDKLNVPGAEQLNGGLLTADDRPSSSFANHHPPAPLGLVGTVFLDHGTLATDGVITYMDGGQRKYGIFEFKADESGPAIHRQAQIDHITLESQVEEKIRLVFDQGNGERNLRLQALDEEHKIWIFNLELETILNIGGGAAPRGEGMDPDFAVSFALSLGWPQWPLPVPYPTWPGVGGSHKTCNPSRFSGV